MGLEILVVDSNSPAARQQSIDLGGRSDSDAYIEALRASGTVERIEILRLAAVEAVDVQHCANDFDGLAWTGSAFSVNSNEPAVSRAADLLIAAIAARTPCFGSCWGLQLAASRLGGRVEPAAKGPQVKIEKEISATADGRNHPLLSGKPACFQAVQIHDEEIMELPPSSLLLASSPSTKVEAAIIAHEGWEFWGTQYHPEFAPTDLAVQLLAEQDDLVAKKAYPSVEAVRALADGLRNMPPQELAAVHGLDDSVVLPELRRREIAIWLSLVRTLSRC